MLPPIRHIIPLSPEGSRALVADLAEADARHDEAPPEEQLAETSHRREEARQRIASDRFPRPARRAPPVGV